MDVTPFWYLLWSLLPIGIAMPFVSLVAWKFPKPYRILLLVLTASTCLAFLTVVLVRHYNPNYLYAPYVRHDTVLGHLLADTWLISAGLPGAWIRQGHRISRDQVVSLLLLLVSTVAWNLKPYPTARVLRMHFVEHRAEFERLAMMACEDARKPAGDSILVDWTLDTSSGVTHIPPLRLTTYQKLLHGIGLTLLDMRVQDSLLLLNYQTTSMLGGGINGYVYSCRAIVPKPLVTSLDVPGPVRQMRYQAIAPSWYLMGNTPGIDYP